MTGAQWLRLSDLVPEALDLPVSERSAFLDRTCVGPDGAPDPVLRREAAALIAAAEEADLRGALASPVASLLPDDVATRAEAEHDLEAQIGPWHVTGVLGEGGMGVVYRARRSDGLFDREVALKRLRPGLGRRFAGRLDTERRLLARLEHDGIARLYDGGVDDGGAPYLVMEAVDGLPITDYVEAHGLDTDARVRLATRVCEAVAYAHQHLVVHRDLKPSNVLVAADGAVKLLDFGIAKLLEASEPDPDLTAAGVMTPAYAAPEQVRGGAATTATDVYGLGVLFYEVLAGRRPYDLSDATAAEAERAVCEVAPPPPSSVAPPERARALRGDLDTILGKALAKEPARRYASAEGLGDDLRRHLDGLPVQARPATVGYRTRSFVRRNRVPVLAAAAVLVALVAGLGAALWQAREAEAARQRAEARFEVAREAARAMIYDVHDAVAGIPGATPAREVIVARALDYLDRLAASAGDDPALRVDLAGAYLRIANVQGNPTDNNLGRTADARASYRQGLALLRGLPPGLPDSLAAAAAGTEGQLWEKQGVVVAHMVGPDSSLAFFDRAIRAHRRALRLDPDGPDRRTYLATSHINRGDYLGHPFFPHAGRPDAALAEYARARAILASVPEPERSEFALRMEGITYEREGNLLQGRGDLDGAAAPTRQALELRQRIARRPDATAGALRDVGVSHEAVGRLAASRGRWAEAEREMVAAQTIYARLLADDPESSTARQTVAVGHLNLARLYGDPDGPNAGRPAEAGRHAAEAARLFRALADGDPDNGRLQSLAADAEALRDRIG